MALTTTQTPARISRRTATIAAIGSIILWFWSGVCFRVGGQLMPPMIYLACMTAVGSLTVFVLQASSGKPLIALIKLPPRVIVSGFFGVAVYTIMMQVALSMAAERDVGQVSLLNYLWPIWLVLLAFAMLSEKLDPPRTIIGAMLGFIGVAIARMDLSHPELLLNLPADLTPHALTFTGGFLWALYCVLLRRWKIPEENGGTAFHFAVCAAMAAAIAWSRGQWQSMPPVSGPIIFWILFGGIGPVGLAYHWWELGMKRGAVHLISLLAYFIPIGSSVLIGLFFRQALSSGLIVGAVLIAAGAWIARDAQQQ
ncbi:EamA family transporter [bacterium]|nr:EamA family transporter [bacterium]